jgi:glucose 1-dehydrogenase
MGRALVAILGAGGMLGSDLSETCAERGHEVRGFDLPDFDLTDPGQLRRAVEEANVVVNWVVDEAAARAVVEEINNHIDACKGAIHYRADVSDEDQVKAMFQHTIERFGTVDILVNNAGIQRDAPFKEMTLEQWKKVMDVNLTGSFLCAREAVREFLRRGEVDYSASIGKIIFMSSVHEVIPWAGHVNYAASKGGVELLMKSIAQELGYQKIRVNSIAPGAIQTAINRDAWQTEEALNKLLKLIPYKRIGQTSDIGAVAVWLATDESDYIHGETIFVDGGMTLYPGFTENG